MTELVGFGGFGGTAALRHCNYSGNELFKKKDFVAAAKVYHSAVSYMETLRDAASLWDEDEV